MRGLRSFCPNFSLFSSFEIVLKIVHLLRQDMCLIATREIELIRLAI